VITIQGGSKKTIMKSGKMMGIFGKSCIFISFVLISLNNKDKNLTNERSFSE